MWRYVTKIYGMICFPLVLWYYAICDVIVQIVLYFVFLWLIYDTGDLVGWAYVGYIGWVLGMVSTCAGIISSQGAVAGDDDDDAEAPTEHYPMHNSKIINNFYCCFTSFDTGSKWQPRIYFLFYFIKFYFSWIYDIVIINKSKLHKRLIAVSRIAYIRVDSSDVSKRDIFILY